ncbi:WG repeat-containing protein [Streptomyces sp. NPDC007369]|uniref:WG repeat-containing protein n=1 Tax=Streptomyces sp. NPDC007369 TaxID=3154589 RepID=UPI0033F13B0B
MQTAPPAPHAVPVEGCAPFGRRFALVDGTGHLVRPPDLTAVGPFHGDGRGGPTAPAADLSGSWGYLDGRGRWLAEPALQYATEFDGAGLSRFRADGLWGYADTTGQPVVSARFRETGPFRHGLAVVRTETGVGYADPTGAVVIGGAYRQAGLFGPNGLGAVRQEDGRCGYVDREGRLAVAARFDGARPFTTEGTAPALLGDRWGLIDTTGEWVVEPCFSLFDAFDDNGLAYVIGGDAGSTFAGFVNPRGEVVIRRKGEMDDELRCGLLKVGDNHTRGFLDATGAWAILDEYEWTDRFDAGGAAVARALDPRAWGVLRADGTFTATPHREPLTDTERWITGFDGGHGLAPFLTDEGDVVHVGRDGRDVCRVELTAADGSAVTLRDASGGAVWQVTAEPGTFERHGLFLSGDPRTYVGHTETREADIAAVAQELLELPAREFYPRSLIFDRSEDPYDLSELDEYDLERTEKGAMQVIASTWLAAEWLSEYPFLLENTQDRFEDMCNALEQRLGDRFGAPLADAVSCLRSGDGERSATWRTEDGRHLVLQFFCLVGDGDHEFRIWLAVTGP